MKKLLLALFTLTSVFYTSAQCINFDNDTLVTCAGVPVTFTGVPGSSITNVQELADFNSGVLPAGWSTSGGTTYSQPCGPGIDNTPYFWASTSGGGTPFIQSNTYDFSNGGYVTFDFYYAVQGGAAPCEGPDLANEGMQVEYSIDGGLTWVPIVYYSPGGFELPSNPGTTGSVASGQTAYTVWNSIVLDMPPGAQTPSTVLRWIQEVSSGTCCDNWGVDNVNVYGTLPGINYLWNTGATTLDLTASSMVDSTFVISVFDGNNSLVCQDSAFLEISGQGFDNNIHAIFQPLQQGQSRYIFIDAYNDGCPPQSGEIVVKLDPTLLTFGSSTPAPDVITADSLIYNYNNLYLNGPHHVIAMEVQVSQSAVVGDTANVDMYITPISGDVNPFNNVKNYDIPIVASYDPNDKKVYPVGDCDVGYVPNDQLMTYTIRFQNTGTAPAIDVRINDIIDTDLNPSTLRVVAASHNYEVDWVSSNTVDFRFEDINLPHQSLDDLGSNGYIIFEIEQVPGLAHGTTFSNFVDIYFDFNAPITTNQVVNTVTDGSHAPIGDTLEINAASAYNWNGELLTSSGVYTQLIPLPDGCDSTAILLLILDSDVGLDELGSENITIYPNPAKNQVTIAGSHAGVFRLMTASGQIILEQETSGEGTIRWESIASGVYFVEVVGSNKTYREKLIIQE